MIWNIRAAEDLVYGDFIEFTTDIDGKLTCRKAVKPESIAALAGRNIVKSEMLVFDTAHRTTDFVRLRFS
jgi:hypothetical protein